MKFILRVFIALLLITGLMQNTSAQSPLSAGEYFIDTDPGEGSGTPLTSPDGQFNELFEEFTNSISTSLLSEGVHTLYVRFRNIDDSWGNVLAKPFIVREESAFLVQLPSKLTNAEYFIDADPGLGNGIALDVADGNYDGVFENIAGSMNTSSFTEGAHTLYVRFRNSNNAWGNVLAKPFIVREESAFLVQFPPKLTNAEYFIDADPGEGNGAALNVTDGNYDGVFENITGSLNSSSFTDGAHTLFVRFRNSNNAWGNVLAKPFIVREESAFFVQLPPNLTNAEYFVDADPGLGNGTALNVTDGNYDGVFENIAGSMNTSSFTEGAHTLFVRFKNSNDAWGNALAKPFIVREESAFLVQLPPKLTNAEYFVDADPGLGNGTALDVTDGNYDGVFENITGNLNSSSFTDGAHTLFVRFRNSNDTWGNVLAKPFVVRDESAFTINMPPKMVSAEYFIDSDSGSGDGIALKAADGSFDQFTENVFDTLKTNSLNEDIHSIGMRFLESNGNWSNPFYSIIEIKNITAPLQPTGLTAIARNRKAILNWFKNPDHDISNYVLYRSLTYDFVPDSTDSLATVSKNDTSYIDRDLTNGVQYFYKIKAVDVANLYSEASGQAVAVPFNTPPESFVLHLPADKDTLANVTDPTLFVWKMAKDIDEDSLSYTIWIHGPNLDTTISNIADTTVEFSGNGVFIISSTYAWKVDVSDGTDWTACIDSFTFVTSDFVGVNDNENAIPGQFSLYQNYPNPFNPTTTIRFDLLEQSRVVLRIYNILGHEVRTLVSGEVNAGSHSYTWNGKNQSGKDVSSGIYLYRIEADKFSRTMKLLLMR